MVIAGRSARDGQTQREAEEKAAAPGLGPVVRRHLGRNLRGLYADTLSTPLGERIETLLERLDRPKV